MIHAYNELYLNTVMHNLGELFDKIEPHTHLFVSKALFFLSIFEKKYRKISNYCAYVNEFSQLIYKVYKCIFLLCICH